MQNNYQGFGSLSWIPSDHLSGYQRPDGSFKGAGYFGPIKNRVGQELTELSISVDDMLIPLLVPTLNKDEISSLVRSTEWHPPLLDKESNISDNIVRKAISHALMRKNKNLPVFNPTPSNYVQKVREGY